MWLHLHLSNTRLTGLGLADLQTLVGMTQQRVTVLKESLISDASFGVNSLRSRDSPRPKGCISLISGFEFQNIKINKNVKVRLFIFIVARCIL